MSEASQLPSRREWAQKNAELSARVSEAANPAAQSKKTSPQSEGPTQHGGSADNKSWASRPGIAKVLRWVILITPSVLSFLATFTLARRYPPYEIGISRLLWWIGLFSIGVIVLIVSEKISRRLLPLAALFKLSLVFPDEAPSRFSLAMKTNSTRKLERRLAEVREHGIPDDTAEHAELMLELVAALSLHDRLTRGHCERVRAYTDMIAEEMKLPEEDAAKLRWAALLHDVGKIFVASEVLNKVGRPTEDEWESLKSHTWKGDELIGPLREFLGPWGLAVRNHHERWDGNGYPDRLAGRDIPLGGRIVAVADAFDVMTSARSYKEPRPASEAREEIARCAGGQFDPDVARAFLNIGLGRLRFAVGPLSWLANVSAVGNAPSLIGTAASQTILPFVATAAATVVSVGGFGAPPTEIAFEGPPITVVAAETTTDEPVAIPNVESEEVPEGQPVTPQAQQGVVTLSEDTVSTVVLSSDAGGAETIFLLIRGPENGTLSLPDIQSNLTSLTAGSRTPAPRSQLQEGQVVAPRLSAAGRSASTMASYIPDQNFHGTDEFRFRACNAAARNLCSDAVVTLRVLSVNDAPVAFDNSITIAEDSTLILTPVLVLANDTDVDGDELTVTWIRPASGSSTIASGTLSYRPPAHSNRDLKIRYRACDALACDEAQVNVEVTAVDDAPLAADDTVVTLEDVSLVISDTTVLSNDLEFDGAQTRLTWDPHPDFDIATSTFTPQRDSTASALLSYQLCDVGGPLCDRANVTVIVTAQPDNPIASGETITQDEDTLFEATTADLLANDVDPDGGQLTIVWGEPDIGGGTFTTSADLVSYNPPQDYVGTVRIPYVDCSGTRCSESVEIVIEFVGVNDPPALPNGLTFGGFENLTTSVTLESIADEIVDVDDDRADITIEILAPLPSGFTFDPDPSNPIGFSYSPAPNSIDPVSIAYRACDGSNACTDGVMTLTFIERDDPPDPLPYVKTIDEDTRVDLSAAAFHALANDSDSPLDELTFSFTQTNPTLGTPTYDSAAQLFSYQTNSNEYGDTVVTYTVCDLTTTSGCPSNTMTITVTPVDDPPTIFNSPVVEQHAQNATVIFDDLEMRSLVDDVDTAAADLIFNYEPVASGTLTQIGQGFSFTPALNYAGILDIRYRVCDASSCSTNLGEIRLDFDATDDPPQPSDIVIAPFDEDPPDPIILTRAVLVAAANDSDSAPTDLVFTAGTPSVDLGPLSEQANGDWHFDPNLNANGTTTFPFQVCDANTDPGPNCAAFDVTFDINPVNDKPIIDILTTTFPGTEDIETDVSAVEIFSLNLFSDSDSPTSELRLFISDPGSGLTVHPSGKSFTYSPIPGSNADVVLEYIVCDADGACSDETGQMVLTFEAVDDPPETTDFVLGPMDEDPSPNPALTRAVLEANTTDPDTPLSTLTYVVSGYSGDDLGGWSDPGDGGLQLTVDPDVSGSATYQVDVCDQTSCGLFYIDVTVNPVNDPPQFTSGPSAVSTSFAPPVDVVLPSDYTFVDPDDNEKHTLYADPVPASEGILAFDNAAKEWVFSPNPGFGGTQVTIAFRICDRDGECAWSGWVVNVETNEPPVFGDVPIPPQYVNLTREPSPFSVTDADGDAISITADTLPAGLTISGSNGSYTITGAPTDPANLGQVVAYTIDATDGIATTTFSGSITFSDQGVSPDAGKIIFSEVAYDNIRACAGAICEEEMEEAEAVNISGSSVSILGWTLQDHPPGGTPDANGRVIDLSNNYYSVIQKWPTTISPNEYVLFSTFKLGGNVTPWDIAGDDLWLLDADGLIVDYVGWQEPGQPAMQIPDQKLGMWDSGRGAMLEIGGKPDPNNRTTIALATVSDANTAACWEFTATGNAATGDYICPAADTTLTIDHPLAQGQFGMRGSTVHSLYYPNWQ